MRRKKTTDQFAEGKEWVFSFDLKEESADEQRTDRRSEFLITSLNKTEHIRVDRKFGAILTSRVKQTL